MRIVLFGQLLSLLTIVAIAGVFLAPVVFPDLGAADILLHLIQFEALAILLSAMAAYALPRLIGVMKGEAIFIVAHDPMSNRTYIKIGKALETRKKGQEIRVSSGGPAEVAVVDEYSGIITPARVSLKPESGIKVI